MGCCQEVEGGRSFPLLSAGEATTGALWTLLDCLIQGSHGHTQESAAKGHKGEKGSGASLLWGKAERAGTVRPEEEQAQGGLTLEKEMRAGYFPWYPEAGPEAVCVTWNTGDSAWKHQETIFHCECDWSDTGGLKKLRNLHPWDIQKLSMCGPG